MDKEKTISELCQEIRMILIDLREEWKQRLRENEQTCEKESFSDEGLKQENAGKTDTMVNQQTSPIVDSIVEFKRRNKKKTKATLKSNKIDTLLRQGRKNINMDTDNYFGGNKRKKKNELKRNRVHNYISQGRKCWKEGGLQDKITKNLKREKRKERGWSCHRVRFKERGEDLNTLGWMNKENG